MGACTHDPRRLMIVTELMKTDLEHLLRDKQQASNLSLYRRMIIAREAALGLAWLHGADPILIHRDVKPSNFLVDDMLRCKITDFGLSQIRHRGERLIDRAGAVGTPLYMAPEVLNGAPFTEKSDMYSFGLVLWVLLTAQVPYSELDNLSNDSFADAVCAGRRPALPSDIPPALRRLIKECWADEPSLRPTAGEVAEALAQIVLAVAILDDAARAFWQQHFGIKEEVAWRDAEPALLEFFGAVETAAAASTSASSTSPNGSGALPVSSKRSKSASVAASKNGPRSAYLHALLCKPRDNGTEVVPLEWFGKVIDWFGPITAPQLDEMYATLSEPWFHGDVATTDAERMLSDQPIGSFLVRFSNQSRGFFTISRVASSNAIHHQRVQHRPLLPDFRMFDHQYETLRKMIVGETDSLKLTQPCPGSKFHNVHINRSVIGYQNDLSAAQEIWLSEATIGDT